MHKSFRILSLFMVLSLALLFSCAGKKSTASGKDKDRISEETLSSEGTSKDSPTIEGEEGSMAANLSLDMLERVYFDFDDANLRSEARDALKKDYEILKANPKLNITIEGHCDDRGSEEYNLALGERRAESIRKYLQDLGLSQKRINIISYGEEKPLMVGSNEEAWSKNRRGEIVAK